MLYCNKHPSAGGSRRAACRHGRVGMRWFRTHIGLGSHLALFALAIQLVLSFGHVHVGKLAPSSPQAGISLAQLPDGNNAPGRDRHSGANDFCAICATISLIASSALPEPARLAPPLVTASSWPYDFSSTVPSSASHFPFQARAPPVA